MLKRLQKYRLEAQLTQQELADRLGVSVETVQKWECRSKRPRSTRTPSVAKLKDLARVLKVSVDELL